ncbi:MAG: tetratricopeptide repeat protein [Leptolyngbyaceae cyanobacterium bins.59]|nr:tetratricopeptide repeat protein [Leptolyngbyaceae cyanobacterium bins.59]
MSEKRGRVIVNVVLILAVLAFVGVSMVPLLEGTFRGVQPSTATTGAAASPSAKQSELESQARGYELVLQREPENQTALRGLIDTRVQLSRVRLSQGDREGAKADVKAVIDPLEKLAKQNPTETRYSVLLAQAKQYLGDREGAAQAYRTILATQPGEPTALQGLVALLMEQNRPEAAIGLLQETLKNAPKANQVQPNSVDVTSVQLLLGQVYAEQKRYEEALSIYDAAMKADQKDFRPVLAKAIVLKEQGKTDQARPLFVTASSLAPAQYKDQINQLAGTASPSPGSPAAPGSISPTSPPTASPKPEATGSSPESGSPEPQASPSVPAAP